MKRKEKRKGKKKEEKKICNILLTLLLVKPKRPVLSMGPQIATEQPKFTPHLMIPFHIDLSVIAHCL